MGPSVTADRSVAFKNFPNRGDRLPSIKRWLRKASVQAERGSERRAMPEAAARSHPAAIGWRPDVPCEDAT
jgi:hypothetical protein